MKKHNDKKQHKKLKKKANYKTTIYQDKYVLHPDTDSFGGWEVNCSYNLPCSVNNAGDYRLSKKNDDIKYSDQQKLETMKFKILPKC